jgi:hypothetical protein
MSQENDVKPRGAIVDAAGQVQRDLVGHIQVDQKHMRVLG